MSELEARKYTSILNLKEGIRQDMETSIRNLREGIRRDMETSIRNLRKEIRRDMEDINLLRQTAYINARSFNFYNNYLLSKIDTNIEQLINIEKNND